MNSKRKQSTHEAFEMLLPWYVNGTLEGDELTQLEKHLPNCEHCRDSAALLREMQGTANTEIPTPIVPRPQLEKLLDRIDGQSASGRKRFRTPSIAVAAAIAVIAVSVILLVSNRGEAPQQRTEFEVLTSGTPATAMDFIFAIQFEAGISAAAQQRFYERVGGTAIGPADDPAWSRLAIQLPTANIEDVHQFTADLESMDEVRAVKVLAIPSRLE